MSYTLAGIDRLIDACDRRDNARRRDAIYDLRAVHADPEDKETKKYMAQFVRRRRAR